MNKHFLAFYAYFLATFISAYAQTRQQVYDQYKRETKNIKEDTNKVLRCIKYAGLLSLSPDTALSIIKKADDLSRKLNYQRGIELSIYERGIFAENKKDYPSAIRYYNEAAKIAESHKFTTDTYAIYNSSLNIYYYLADYPNALYTAQKGLSLAEQLNDKESQARYDNQIGFIYQNQEKADESIKYYTQYLNLSAGIGNRMMIADAYNGIGDGYVLKKDYKTSLSYFFKALKIYEKMNGTGERFDRGRWIARHVMIAYTSYKISDAYKQAGNYKQALHYSQVIFGIYHEKIKAGATAFNNYDLANYFINAGDIYRLLKNHKQANTFLNKGLAIARSIRHREDMRNAYDALSKNFASENRYDSAYRYHMLFTGLKDSIINEKVSRQISTLEVGRRDKEIALLTQQQKLKEAETARQDIKQNFLIGCAAFIAAISFFLLYIRNRIKQQKLVFEKQLALQAERQRISSDMHDDIGTGLSTMLIYINMLRIKLEGSANGSNIERISALGNELVDQMKEIVWSLNPGNDRLDSLVLYLRQYFVLLFEPLPYQIHVDFPLIIPDIQLKSETRRNIFLCVKESLNNVIKHAEATQVWLVVQIMRNTLVIQVKDNGKGLKLPAPGNSSGNGLKNIRQRIEAMKGKFNIAGDNGTAIRFEIDLTATQTGSSKLLYNP